MQVYTLGLRFDTDCTKLYLVQICAGELTSARAPARPVGIHGEPDGLESRIGQLSLTEKESFAHEHAELIERHSPVAISAARTHSGYMSITRHIRTIIHMQDTCKTPQLWQGTLYSTVRAHVYGCSLHTHQESILRASLARKLTHSMKR